MERYNDQFIKNANGYIDFRDKTILEIGCGNGTDLRKIASEYKPRFIIGIDNSLDNWWSTQPSKGGNWEVDEGDAANLQFPDNYFDVVISLATFEHISDLESSLKEIKRVLKPFGKFYTEYSPIWTSVIGHHYDFWIDEDNANLIPPWGHLWMNKEEMIEYLVPKVGIERAHSAAYSIYESKIINRLARSDHYRLVLESGLWIREINESISLSRTHHFGNRQSEMTQEVYAKLNGLYKPEELAVSGFRLYLEKYASF